MKRTIFLLGICIFISQGVQSQWVSTYWGQSNGDISVASARGLAVTIDNFGNSYATGYCDGGTTHDDILTIKYNNYGDTLWTRTYNGTGDSDDQGLTLSTDPSGNVYVTGYTTTSGQGTDIIVIKYSSNGTQMWAVTYNGNGNAEDKAFGIIVDAAGEINLTGYCTNSGNNIDMVTLKYNASGTLQWASVFNGSDSLTDKSTSLVLDNLNNVYVTGTSASLTGNNNIVVIKYNSSGEELWNVMYNGAANGDDQAYSIGLDASSNVYIAGYVTTLTSNTDCIILKYGSTGTLLWENTFNGGANSEDKAFGIAVDAVTGSGYITGFVTGTSGKDYVTIKYNSSGVQQWVSTYNGPAGGDDKARAIALLNNSIFITGTSLGYSNTNDFATVKYSAYSGWQTQVSRYSVTGGSQDFATDIATNASVNKVCITGFSDLGEGTPGVNSVLTTLMYDGTEETEVSSSPGNYALHQNYPNPFNPTTTIKFDVVKASKVKLAVYDILGKEVTILINEFMNTGTYEAVFTSTNIPSGVYFYVLTAGEYKDVKKMTLVK